MSSSAHTIGVDVGGTKISSASLRDGSLSEPRVVSTEKSSSDALVDQLAEQIDAQRSEEVAAVGIGVPSAVEFETGTAKSGVNVPLAGVALREILTDRLGLPVFVDNDANVAALAEAHDAERLVTEHLVMLTVGTGVGGGLVLGGRVYRGATGAGAELGHALIGVKLDQEVPMAQDRFPQPGSLEALAAGTALDRLAEASARDNPDSPLGRVLAARGRVLGPDVVAAARDGDPESLRLFDLLGGRLGIGIASAINTFDPQEVVIGGGAASGAGDLLLEPARRAAQGYILSGVGAQTTIRLARHGVQAGVYGAALLAAQEATLETEAMA